MSHSHSRRKTSHRFRHRISAEPSNQNHEGRHGFLPHLLRALPVIVGLAIAMFIFEYLGLFTGFETMQLDSLLRLHARQTSKEIVVVEISDQDYHNPNLFYGTSPLDPSTALDLIESVKKYNPSVIGVDLETTDWLQVCNPQELKGPRAYDKAKCDLLQKRIAALANEQARSTHQTPSIVWAVVPQNNEAPLKLEPALGGLPLSGERQGVPQFPLDRDGAVRHFQSRVEVASEEGKCPANIPKVEEVPRKDGQPPQCFVPSLARAVFNAYPVNGDRAKPSEEPVIFNFYGDRYRFPIIEANNFFPSLSSPMSKDARDQLEAARANLLAGKIVLIGGAYKAARDEYFTPLGAMKGVELNALAVQTDLSGGGIHEVQEVSAFILDIVIGSLIVWIFFKCDHRPLKALLWSLVIIPAAMISSLLLFKSAAYWFNFIPLACGVIFHQLFELAEGSHHLQEQLEEEANATELAHETSASKHRAMPEAPAAPPIDVAAQSPEVAPTEPATPEEPTDPKPQQKNLAKGAGR